MPLQFRAARAARRPVSVAIRAALALSLLPAATLASAQDATTLDAVQVTAPIPKDTGTATKTDTPLLEVPQSISIVTARDLRDRGLHAVDEAMWYVAGAQGGVYGMDTRSEWLLVRGFKPPGQGRVVPSRRTPPCSKLTRLREGGCVGHGIFPIIVVSRRG